VISTSRVDVHLVGDEGELSELTLRALGEERDVAQGWIFASLPSDFARRRSTRGVYSRIPAGSTAPLPPAVAPERANVRAAAEQCRPHLLRRVRSAPTRLHSCRASRPQTAKLFPSTVTSVLQPVRRRRRRRSRLRPLALAASLLLLGGLLVWLFVLRSDGGVTVASGTHRAAPRPSAPRHPARRHAPTPAAPAPLLTGRPAPRVQTADPREVGIVIDTSDRVLWAKQAHRQLPIASLTKIMTSLLVLERLPLGHDRPDRADRPASRSSAKACAAQRVPGQAPLACCSTRATTTRSPSPWRPAAAATFLELMNRRARSLGLHDALQLDERCDRRRQLLERRRPRRLTRFALRDRGSAQSSGRG
jgi:hypothetical protein